MLLSLQHDLPEAALQRKLFPKFRRALQTKDLQPLMIQVKIKLWFVFKHKKCYQMNDRTMTIELQLGKSIDKSEEYGYLNCKAA
jgi:hypothetical protein